MKAPKLRKIKTVNLSEGRDNEILEPDADIRFNLRVIPMSSECYDEGGAYWGQVGIKTGLVWHAFGVGAIHLNQVFVRACDREDAQGKVLAFFKNATFFGNKSIRRSGAESDCVNNPLLPNGSSRSMSESNAFKFQTFKLHEMNTDYAHGQSHIKVAISSVVGSSN